MRDLSQPGSSGTAIEKEDLRAIITLVHGTFARDASWTLETSDLCKSLAARRNIQTARFTWSGRNRFGDRQKAAQELAFFLRQQREGGHGVPQIVVGHSHGGSVLAYLLARDQEVAETISGAAFLATPFVDARARADWPVVASITLIAALFCVSAALAATLLSVVIVYGPRGLDVPLLSVPALFAHAISVFAIPAIALLVTPKAIGQRYNVERVADSISTSHLPPGRYLFIRATGDEAASALGTAQFASWLMTGLVSRITRPLSRLLRHRFALFFFMLLAPWGGMIPTLAYFDNVDWTAPLAEFVNLAATERSVAGWWVAGIAISGCFMFLISLAFSVFWIGCCLVCWLAHVSFGRASFSTALFIDLAADALPLGPHTLFRVPWSPAAARRLSHSAPYERAGADILNDWIESLLREPSATVSRA